ncbi:MAG: Hsp70 family protein, partial [Actinomycetota bacterium]
MTVFGIDLGTTYSCIASIDDSGRASVIKNSDGEDTTPSVVWFEDEQSIVVGRSAKDSAIAYPD